LRPPARIEPSMKIMPADEAGSRGRSGRLEEANLPWCGISPE
jgi:hypothetical protein